MSLAQHSTSLTRRCFATGFFKRLRRYTHLETHHRPIRQTVLPDPRLDYRKISENSEQILNNARKRKAAIPTSAINDVAATYTDYKRISNALSAKRNARSMIGERIRESAGANDDQAKQAALAEGTKLKAEVSALEAVLARTEDALLTLALAIPNDTHPDTPLGNESSAVILSTHGPEPIPATSERDHVSICKKFGLLDLESGSTVTGSSWYYLLHEAALLEIALTNYAFSIALHHGFIPVTTPDVVRSDVASRCGFQPRDLSDQLYHIKPPAGSLAPELVLSGTSEIPLAGMFANKILASNTLPLKVVGLGRAFRAEAGARGTDTRGLYRVHQFTKVELFAVTTETSSEEMMQEMMQVQQTILDGLGFPFRVLDMPSEELGASAYRKYDMEAWMPGRSSWGEVSSLSNCTDYQARRLHIRYRPQPPESREVLDQQSKSSLPFAHTLNGTAAAIPRLIVGLLENGALFNEEGDLIGLRLPTALKPFWIGLQNGRGFVQWGL